MIEIVNGAVVPEFGSAAIIVLVVAIVSIVAITYALKTKHTTKTQHFFFLFSHVRHTRKIMMVHQINFKYSNINMNSR